ncbi:MAG: proline dehydrogenase family protein [Cytophagales bacterium]|nr:proline dehydrogenase family protein [Cytophagales bacterium]
MNLNKELLMNFDNTEVAFATHSDQELKESLFLFNAMSSPTLVKIGTAMLSAAFKLHLPVKGIVKATLFKHFCGGESIKNCQQTIDRLFKHNIGTILDFSVEGADDEESFDEALEETLKNIQKARNNPKIPFCVFKPTGLASARLLEKIQLRQSLSTDETRAFQRIRERFDTACQTAFENDVALFVDAEDSWYQDPIDQLTYEMMEKYNRKKAIVYNTYQMYKKNMLEKIENAWKEAQEKGYHIGAKLVRGAYMEIERERAAKMGYEDPIMPTLEDTHRQFNDGIRFCTEHIEHMALACCSHNEESNRLLTELIEENEYSPADSRFFFAQLFGMSNHISFNLAKEGYNVAKYVPYGPVAKTLPYLFRRAEENTSIAGQSGRELTLIRAEIKRRKLK